MAFYIFLLLVIGEFPGNFPHALSSAADEPVLRHPAIHPTASLFWGFVRYSLSGFSFKAPSFSPRFTQHDASAYTA